MSPGHADLENSDVAVTVQTQLKDELDELKKSL
jgi:hypothetical protein